jgi:hypothetical protein
MARPRNPAAATEPGLFPAPAAGPFRKGRHERQTDAAISAARAAGTVTATDAGVVTLLRALARSLDLAERTEQPYAVASVARELRATLEIARLTPAANGPGPDPFADLMAALNADDPAPA